MNSFFNKKIRLLYFIIICLVLMCAAAVLTYSWVIGGFGAKEYADDAKKYIEIEKLISENYVDDIGRSELYESAASAMVRSLGDKWSYYMTAEQYAAYKLSSANEYAGIGVSLKQNDKGEFEISSVDPGTPAYTAGLTAGQFIVSVDGEKVKGMTITELQELIRSKLDKNFNLEVSDGKGDESTVNLACEAIYQSPVSHRLLDDGVGYIKIRNFEAGCCRDTVAAIEYLISIGAKSFVFDLRDNPGGLLSELAGVLDYILPEGDLFVSVDKTGRETVLRSDKICLKYNMAVLVNENTYSAAEFFAAAIQEYDWGTVVGGQTGGKARSQSTVELSDGSAIHISTGKYLTPDRKDLAAAGGVTPDVPVQNTADGTDLQLDTAVSKLRY